MMRDMGRTAREWMTGTEGWYGEEETMGTGAGRPRGGAGGTEGRTSTPRGGAPTQTQNGTTRANKGAGKETWPTNAMRQQTLGDVFARQAKNPRPKPTATGSNSMPLGDTQRTTLASPGGWDADPTSGWTNTATTEWAEEMDIETTLTQSAPTLVAQRETTTTPRDPAQAVDDRDV